MIATIASGLLALGLAVIVVYGLVWVNYVHRAMRRSDSPTEWTPDRVLPRIMAYGDSPSVIQETVDGLPEGLCRPQVVVEEPVDIDGADVHVVPEDFSARAIRKGRAQEWARRTLTDRGAEYVLYLDEDTIVPASFEGLPDADIVQLHRRPKTRSWLIQLMEVHRAGIIRKELGFRGIPFHAWGGAIAVRRSVEDQVTWDRHTIVEDTAFVWEATRAGYTHTVVDVPCHNQAPPSLMEAFRQRRRWGALLFETDRLPPGHRTFVRFQLLAWCLMAFTGLLVAAALVMGVVGSEPWLLALVAAVAGINLAWSYVGWRVQGESVWMLAALAAGGFALANFLNLFGRVWGFLSPPETFDVTEKETGVIGEREPDEDLARTDANPPGGGD